MVLLVIKHDIHPDKREAYLKWSEGAIKRILAVPGLVEYRVYRTAVGPSQVVTTSEFADLAAWAAFQSNEDVQQLLVELHTFALNISIELWGPSPVVPVPLRPGK